MTKIVSPEHKIFTDTGKAAEWRQALRKEGKKLALTNGCFDILHRGHAEYLLAARNLGDALIVLLNADASVRELKGPSRPVNTEYDRAFLLASLEYVDAVLIFDGTRCHREIAALEPDCYAKGGDYTEETLDPDERAALQQSGTEIRFIRFVPGLSTSNTIRKIRADRLPPS